MKKIVKEELLDNPPKTKACFVIYRIQDLKEVEYLHFIYLKGNLKLSSLSNSENFVSLADTGWKREKPV